MLSLNYENINYVMTQILKLSCASFSYVSMYQLCARPQLVSIKFPLINSLKILECANNQNSLLLATLR